EKSGLMPDPSSLYPQPPTQQQGLLSGNPLQLIQTLGALQDYAIKSRQAPALGQRPETDLQRAQTELGVQQRGAPALGAQPGANLAGTNIQNATALIQQQDLARRSAASALSGALSGLPNPT